MANETVLKDGSFDFSGGVDSAAVTTVRSPIVPRGIRRDQLAWAGNATVRGGGINQRTGWLPLVQQVVASGFYQGGFLHDPILANPYLLLAVSGHIYQVLVEAPFTVTDLSAKFGVFHPATADQFFFAQGEQFTVIQAGDLVTNPLFWDGATLRRSRGIIAPGNPLNELPPATAMVYYAGRMWYAFGRKYTAGDIVDGPSGTVFYAFSDSILKVTENPLATGGDGFIVPSTAGTIRALGYSATTDTALGQGNLYIFTRKQAYSLNVPVKRTDWIAATASNQPLQTVVQINNGAVSDRPLVHVNGDLFYQSLDPAIRSFILATRYFRQWGNKVISSNINRALQFNNRALMRFSSGIYFDNRLLQLILPQQTASGVTHQAIAPLDFDIISEILTESGQNADFTPAWEGTWEGLDFFQLFTGDYGGLQRAFGVVLSRLNGAIQVFELSTSSRTDGAFSPTSGTYNPPVTDNRVQWYVEFPAFTWQQEFEMKELVGGHIWADKVFGDVRVIVEYRVDADPCYRLWYQEEFCVARTCAEDLTNPNCYPIGPNYREGYRFPIVLPKPPSTCDSMGERPTIFGYQFQVRVTVKGWMRIRGIVLFAQPRMRSIYEGLKCFIKKALGLGI